MKSNKAKIAVRDLKVRKDVKGGVKLNSGPHSPTNNKNINSGKTITIASGIN